MIIPIQQVSTWPTPATQLRVDGGYVTLGTGAAFGATLLDSNGNAVSQVKSVSLTDSQYAAWTGDDTFVAECVAQNLGLVVDVASS
jgi:hypothetical protein